MGMSGNLELQTPGFVCPDDLFVSPKDLQKKFSPLHKPLAEDCIRVLELQGLCLVDIPDRPGVQDFAIKCSLATVPLVDSDEASSRPDGVVYTALSYVWGNKSPGFRRYVCCDGEVFPITINLFDALRQLVLDDDPETRTMWVDAICINQDDNEEKSKQVGLMARIFAYATKVLVWLSSGTDIYGSMAEAEELYKYVSGEGFRRRPSSGAYEKAVKFVQSHAWLQRAWTFQEIVVAKRAFLRLGQYQIGWDVFCALFPEEAAFQAIQNCHVSRGSDCLLTLISITWHREATNPRDKIYSLLGVYRSNRPFEIDYSRSIDRVYFDALSRISHDLNHLVFPALLDLDYIDGDISWTATVDREYNRRYTGLEETPETPFSWEKESRRGKSWSIKWLESGKPRDWESQLELALDPNEKPLEFSRFHASWTMSWRLSDPFVVVAGAMMGVIQYGSQYDRRSLFPIEARCMSSYSFSIPYLTARGDNKVKMAAKMAERVREYDRRGNLSSDDFHQKYILGHRARDCSCYSTSSRLSEPRPSAHRSMYLVVLFGAKHLMVLQPQWDPDTQSGTFKINSRFPRKHVLSQLFQDLAQGETSKSRHSSEGNFETMALTEEFFSLKFLPMDFTLQ